MSADTRALEQIEWYNVRENAGRMLGRLVTAQTEEAIATFAPRQDLQVHRCRVLSRKSYDGGGLRLL